MRGIPESRPTHAMAPPRAGCRTANARGEPRIEVACPVDDPLLCNNASRGALTQRMDSEARYVQGMERLVQAVAELSLARDVLAVREIVRTTARQMTGADGASFILREGDECSYVDEDAIGPLWKGRRFPMSACVSGWSMIHKTPVVIEDIYDDPRVPSAAYRPTFVRSLAMVPIRTAAPIGAIGAYWATTHLAEPHEVRLLQALADSTSVALENIRVHRDLEARVRERTDQLEVANAELESFSYSVAHDLQTPAMTIRGFCSVLQQSCRNALNEEGLHALQQIEKAAARMQTLIRDFTELSHVSRISIQRETVDLTTMVSEILQELAERTPGRRVHTQVAQGVTAQCDGRLIRIVLENLLGNAWKFTSRTDHPTIEFAATAGEPAVYSIRDNGVGFDMATAPRLFAPFERFHMQSEFPGTGVGLATVKRIIDRHGGKIWAESAAGEGSTFFFTVADAAVQAGNPPNN